MRTKEWLERARGALSNDTPKTDFSAYGEYANLRTEAEFEDFQLPHRVSPAGGHGGNSGIYLRGLYEVQVTHKDRKCRASTAPEPCLAVGTNSTAGHAGASGMRSTSRS